MRLEPQPARALALLLSRAGEVVTRDELRAAIWGEHTHVDYDRGLAYCASQIRTALGDSGENPRFLQTLPKRGFRFVAPVATESAANQAPEPARPQQRPPSPPATAPAAGPSTWRGRTAWLTAVAALAVAALIWIRADTPPRQAIVAVTIFDNETGDAALDGFVTGLSDLVVSRLTELAPDRVGVIGNAAALRQPRAIRNLKALAGALPPTTSSSGSCSARTRGCGSSSTSSACATRSTCRRGGSSAAAWMSPVSTARSSPRRSAWSLPT